MSIVKGDMFQLEAVMAIIRKTAPSAEVRDEKQHEISIALKVMDCVGFETLFESLEGNATALGIGCIGVSVSTIKDVYVK